MIDELDFAFDEHDDRSRHRRRHAQTPVRKKKKKKRRGRTVLALVMTMALLGGLGIIGWLGYDKLSGMFNTPDYQTVADAPKVMVEIKDGATLTDIAKELKAKDVILSEQAFVDASNENSLAKNIQAGFYEIPTKMSGADAVTALLNLENRVVNGVTINEGWTSFKIYRELSEKLDIPVKEFKAAAKDPIKLGVPDWWFTRTDGKKSSKSIEGFLFPATYEFPPDVTAESALKMMVQKFLNVTTELDFVKFVEENRGGISPYETLIVASLAQAEAGKEKDLGKVARVAYNRVYKKMLDCACLQFDVTVNYSRELAGKEPKPSSGLTDAELNDPNNPYNRKVAGLVPTPINSPGKAALLGAMDPPEGNWIYFVAIDKKGTTAFSATDTQFCADIEKAISAGVLTSGSRCG